ncbi:cell division protein SepF [Candidatus Woesearchaeota archaeon]|nr:cell division protein SepF [Candidatus Woesearchaeota archaeon]
MADFASWLKEKASFGSDAENPEDYLEVPAQRNRKMYFVRTFLLEDFNDVKPVLDCIRKGDTVALVDIAPLQERDEIDLKRAINKLKSATAEVSGSIVGLQKSWIVVTPNSIEVERQAPPKKARVEEE